MANIIVRQTEYGCPLCSTNHSSRSKAESCRDKHEQVLKEVLPKYEVGKHVKAYYFKDVRRERVVTVIVKISGSLFEMQLLLESENGERWWNEAVEYQTINPENFYCLPVVD
ncbi:MAG: hypothetical protein ABR875_00790 [Minisyncoccia bacterium]